MVGVSEISAGTWIHCNFFTKPKIILTVQRPKTLPDGYPSRPKTLGERIKKERMDLELFQKDVARMIGVSADTITNWEKGRTKPCRRYISEIKLFLEVEE
jgi:DNA-binding transcriptional regulator YiaG